MGAGSGCWQQRGDAVILILSPDRNTRGKHDANGAFWPEADAFEGKHGGVQIRIDQSQPPSGRFRQTLAAIEEHAPNVLAYFGHGLRHSLPQLGATLGNVASLAGALALGSTAPLVILYACSAGDGESPGGEGGFADHLRDHLLQAEASGARVLAHTVAAHTTQNPYVREFSRAQMTGGKWLVDPGSVKWKRWVKLLRGPARLQFPFWTVDELERALAEE